MVQSFTEDFSVVWKDPEDAKISWSIDPMHMPRPAPPLAFDVIARMWSDIFIGARPMSINGYIFNPEGWSPPPPTPDIMEKGVFKIWHEEYAPRIEKACKKIRETDYESMTAIELADSLDSIIRDAIEAFRLTMTPVFAFMGPTFELVGFAEKELGEDGGQLVGTLLQASQNATAAAGAGLDVVADAARKSPEVAEALKKGRYDDLESAKGGSEFLAKLRGYLDEFGWRAESWGLPHVPTWAEEPQTALMLIGRYLSDDKLTPAAARKRSLEQRDAAMSEVESRLSGERLAEFKRRLEACAGHVPISEGRARWQLTIVGSVRVPAIALGRKLVDASVIAEPNDVFFLSIAELKEAARNTAQSQKELVAKRKADLERWEHLDIPPFIGPEPSAPPPALEPILTKFFGLGVTPSNDAKVVKGNPASRGTARGHARVILQLSDSDRLQKGDVLVCPTTAPPWTPLFAIASAIVTDTGGVLSHSAICAREYGIPCVVGTQTATREIPDGAMITVDGAEGTVRIER